MTVTLRVTRGFTGMMEAQLLPDAAVGVVGRTKYGQAGVERPPKREDPGDGDDPPSPLSRRGDGVIAVTFGDGDVPGW